MKNIELASPTVMSAIARAAEITSILAAAIVRTHLAHAEKERAVDLGFVVRQRVHTTPYPQERL
jgi:1-deoxy-D-xylulose 5-phosphate reductoisomerase